MGETKKILVLGATGAMGQYLVPELAKYPYQIDAVSLDKVESPWRNVTYIQHDAMDLPFIKELLKNRYDAIVNFMIYHTDWIAYYLPLFLDNTEHYVYLSSYRVYDNKEVPVKETSPRLLDTADDLILRNSDEYGIYKARGENIIRSLPRKNWTIIRPSIIYSFMRYQLVTLEAPFTVGRAFRGKPVLLPAQAKEVQGTMTWAGDVAVFLARLLFNEKALGETFTVATAEHHTWSEIADYYKEICGLKAIWIDKEEYLKLRCSDPYNRDARWQLENDRLFTRIMDNSKLLAATGVQQKDLKTLFDGLSYEIGRCPRDRFQDDEAQQVFDRYLAAHGWL